MAESNKMKEMPVNKLMVQMGIPMILSMALQAVYNLSLIHIYSVKPGDKVVDLCKHVLFPPSFCLRN